MDPATTTTTTVTEADAVGFLAAALRLLPIDGTLCLTVSNSYGRKYSPQWSFSSSKIPGIPPDGATLDELREKIAGYTPARIRERQIAECRQRLAELEGRAP